MGDPGAVAATIDLAFLVLANLRKRDLIDRGVAARGDKRGHAANRVRASAMARAHEQLRVGVHEGHAHRDGRTVGQDRVLVRVELLDGAKDVVPTARIEAGRVVAQLVEDLLHLEGSGERLDQHRCADRALRDADCLLGNHEGIVPEAGLEVRFELRQVEVRAKTACQQLFGVVGHVDRQIKQSSRDRCAVDQEVTLFEVPAARTHDQRRDLVVESVVLALGAGEFELAADCLAEGNLAGQHVVPGGRERIFEVAHKHASARVEGVDHHLRLGWACDLDSSILQRRGCRGDLPVTFANRLGLREEVEQAAGVEQQLAFRARREQFVAASAEFALKPRCEFEGSVRQHTFRHCGNGADDLDLCCCGHGRAPGGFG